MDEAVEICKLRFFLKLVAQLESPDNIEPLPDIDFNVRAGNTLVGYATAEDVKKAMTDAGASCQRRLVDEDELASYSRFEEKLEDVEAFMKLFRQQQTELGGEVSLSAKEKLQTKLKAVEEELNRYLANEYGINLSKPNDYIAWKESHKPFHWFVEFYGIMSKGGFDAIIGNPPYVEYPKVRDIYTVSGFRTESCANLYALCFERSSNLGNRLGHLGMILPNSSISASKMMPMQEIATSSHCCWISNFAWRPSKLFEGADMLLAIILRSSERSAAQTLASPYLKWYNTFRESLLSCLAYNDISRLIVNGSLPKLPSEMWFRILERIKTQNNRNLASVFSLSPTNYVVYYFRAVQYWVKILLVKPTYLEDGSPTETGEMKPLWFESAQLAYAVSAIMSSSLYFVYYITYSSCQVINSRDLAFPVVIDRFGPQLFSKIVSLGKELQDNYMSNSELIERNYSKRGRVFTMIKQHFHIKAAKPIIDEIDQVLARHYGFTDEELDFVINYDIKYRMGRGAGEEEE